MKEIKYSGEEDILLKELGPVETSRFLNIPGKKRLESVRRHREWQKNLNKEEFFKDLNIKVLDK